MNLLIQFIFAAVLIAAFLLADVLFGIFSSVISMILTIAGIVVVLGIIVTAILFD